MAVAVAGRAGEAQHDHVGAEAADVPNDVGKHLLARPLRQCFIGDFRETEVDGAGEELFGSVDLARGQ